MLSLNGNTSFLEFIHFCLIDSHQSPRIAHHMLCDIQFGHRNVRLTQSYRNKRKLILSFWIQPLVTSITIYITYAQSCLVWHSLALLGSAHSTSDYLSLAYTIHLDQLNLVQLRHT